LRASRTSGAPHADSRIENGVAEVDGGVDEDVGDSDEHDRDCRALR
jgi:hypothetical protein